MTNSVTTTPRRHLIAVMRHGPCGFYLVHSALIDRQWRNFFNFIYASCSGRHDVGQGNENVLQHLHSDCRDGASIKRFINLSIRFCLNNVTKLHRLFSKYDNLPYNTDIVDYCDVTSSYLQIVSGVIYGNLM